MNSKVSRRDFLRLGGVVAVASTVAPSLTAFASAESSASSRTLSVGLILPEDSTAGAELLSGVRLSGATVYTQAVRTSSFVQVATAFQELARRTSVVMAMITPFMAKQLEPIVQASGALLVILEAGANVVTVPDESPYILHNTLRYWQSAWATGQHVAQSISPRVLVVSSFYEAGFDSLYALTEGITGSGGQVLQTVITHRTPEENFATLFEAIRHHRPEVIVSLYDNEKSKALAWALQGTPIPHVQAGLLSESSRFGTWSAQLTHPENHAFITAYRQANGKTPTAFALLGYETAEWVKAGRASLSERVSRDELLIALARTTLASPRGTVHLDAHSQVMVVPVYALRDAQQSVINIDEASVRVALNQPHRSGWLSAYATEIV